MTKNILPSESNSALLNAISEASKNITINDITTRRFMKELTIFIADTKDRYPLSTVLIGIFIYLGTLCDEFKGGE